jgi:hypothetical protein
MTVKTLYDKPIKTIAFTISEEGIEKLDAKARALGINRSFLLRSLVDLYLDKLYAEHPGNEK